MWMIDARYRLQVRHAALLVAIDVLVDGPAAVERTQDPCGDGPFAYRVLPGGFELVSALSAKCIESDCDGSGRVRLRVGRAPGRHDTGSNTPLAP